MLQRLVEHFERTKGCRFMSFTYQTKSTGEIARHTLMIGVSYLKACEDDLLELQLRLRNARGIEAIVISGEIASKEETLLAAKEGRFHCNYKKPGLYREVCPNIKISINDFTTELWAFRHTKKILVPGIYKKVNHRPETIIKNNIKKDLKTGFFRTYCLEPDYALTAKINGEVLEFD